MLELCELKCQPDIGVATLTAKHGMGADHPAALRGKIAPSAATSPSACAGATARTPAVSAAHPVSPLDFHHTGMLIESAYEAADRSWTISTSRAPGSTARPHLST